MLFRSLYFASVGVISAGDSGSATLGLFSAQLQAGLTLRLLQAAINRHINTILNGFEMPIFTNAMPLVQKVQILQYQR